MPLLVDRRAAAQQLRFHTAGLHAVPVAELPFKVVDLDKIAEPGMERHDVVILEVDLDEGFPVARVFFNLHTVEHEAGKIQIVFDAEACQVACNVALSGE